MNWHSTLVLFFSRFGHRHVSMNASNNSISAAVSRQAYTFISVWFSPWSIQHKWSARIHASVPLSYNTMMWLYCTNTVPISITQGYTSSQLQTLVRDKGQSLDAIHIVHVLILRPQSNPRLSFNSNSDLPMGCFESLPQHRSNTTKCFVI